MAAELADLVKAQQWEFVALLLLLGAVRTLERLPPDALPVLLELLGDADSPQ